MAAKIAGVMQMLGLSRFDMKYSAGRLSHARIMRCIELYGSRVAPLVRQKLAAAPVAADRAG